jgi:hypothetical protein
MTLPQLSLLLGDFFVVLGGYATSSFFNETRAPIVLHFLWTKIFTEVARACGSPRGSSRVRRSTVCSILPELPPCARGCQAEGGSDLALQPQRW